jgi:hypothetical protein
MNEIRIAVNLKVFNVMLWVWLFLGLLTAIPSEYYELPPPLAFLFATLTGGLLIIWQGFEKGVTFSSTTESTTLSTTTTTEAPKGDAPNEKTDPATATVLP